MHPSDNTVRCSFHEKTLITSGDASKEPEATGNEGPGATKTARFIVRMSAIFDDPVIWIANQLNRSALRKMRTPRPLRQMLRHDTNRQRRKIITGFWYVGRYLRKNLQRMQEQHALVGSDSVISNSARPIPWRQRQEKTQRAKRQKRAQGTRSVVSGQEE